MITLRALRIPDDWEWVRTHVKCVLCEDTRGVVAEKDGEIISAFIADSWSENSVQVHQAILDMAALRAGIHREFARWVFGETGRKMMVGLVPATNEKALRLNEHYGFHEHTRIPDGFAEGVDYVVHLMRADECNYYTPAA